MTSLTGSRLLLLATAVLFSTGGAAIKWCELNSWQVASFRSAVAAVAVLLFIPDARGLNRRGPWLVGSFFSATMLLYVTANKMTTAANTIFLQSTAPLYLVLLSPWLLKEKIRRRDVLLMLALAIGMALFFVGRDEPSQSAPRPLLGNLLAALAGITWAGTILGLRWLGRDDRHGTSNAAVAAGSILTCLIALPFALPVASFTVTDASLILYLGVFQIGLAYALMSRGMKNVLALEAALLLLLEPVLNPFWAWLVQGELPTVWSFSGCTIILFATGAKTVLSSRTS